MFSAESLCSTDFERVKKARELAAEAEAMAEAVFTPALRTDYLRIKKRWTEIADQIEQATGSSAGASQHPGQSQAPPNARLCERFPSKMMG